jgi:hypothetical protein
VLVHDVVAATPQQTDEIAARLAALRRALP